MRAVKVQYGCAFVCLMIGSTRLHLAIHQSMRLGVSAIVDSCELCASGRLQALIIMSQGNACGMMKSEMVSPQHTQSMHGITSFINGL